MAIVKIEDFLNKKNPSYEEGRMLYEQYGSDIFVLAIIREGSGPYHFRRLMEALKDLSAKHQDPPKTSQPIVPTILPRDKHLGQNFIAPRKREIPPLESFNAHIAGETKKPDFETLPEALKQVTIKKNQHWRRAVQLFVEIPFVDSEDDRRDMAITLLKDHAEVQRCWAIIDEYKATGKELVELEKSLQDEINGLSLADLMRESRNIPPNISKKKARLKDLPDGYKKSKVLSKLQYFDKRLELIKERIKALSHEQTDR